jgi:hypothetical protein
MTFWVAACIAIQWVGMAESKRIFLQQTDEKKNSYHKIL